MNTKEQLVEIATASDGIEAALISGALADANIWSSQSGEFVAGFATPICSRITIFVKKNDLEKATHFLSEFKMPNSHSQERGKPRASATDQPLWKEAVAQTKSSYSLMKRRAVQLVRSQHFPKLRSIVRFRTRTLLLLQTILGIFLFAIAGRQSTVVSVFFYVAVCLALFVSASATVWAATNTTKVREEWRNMGQVAVPMLMLLALVHVLLTLLG